MIINSVNNGDDLFAFAQNFLEEGRGLRRACDLAFWSQIPKLASIIKDCEDWEVLSLVEKAVYNFYSTQPNNYEVFCKVTRILILARNRLEYLRNGGPILMDNWVESHFKFNDWMKLNGENFSNRKGDEFHEWLEPSDWSAMCRLSKISNTFFNINKNDVMLRVLNQSSRRVNFLKNREGEFLINQPAAFTCQFDGALDIFSNIIPSGKKSLPILLTSLSQFLIHLKDKKIRPLLDSNRIHASVLFDDQKELKAYKESVLFFKNKLDQLRSQGAPISLKERANLKASMCYSALKAVASTQEEDFRELQRRDSLGQTYQETLRDYHLEDHLWKQNFQRHISKRNQTLLAFFKNHLGFIHTEEEQPKEMAQRSPIRLDRLAVITPNSLNANLRRDLSLLNSSPPISAADGREPYESKENAGDCPAIVMKLFHSSKMDCIPIDHPKKQTIDDLHNPQDGLFPQTLIDVLELLKRENPNFEIDTTFLSVQNTRNALDFQLIAPVQSDVPYIMIPIALMGHYALICIDKKGQRVEFYDSLAQEIDNKILNKFARVYFFKQLSDPSKKENRVLREKSTVRAQYDKNHCGMYIYDFCRRRIQGKSFNEINESPAMSMEVLGLKYQLINKFAK